MANEKRLISADVAKEMIINHANEFSDVLNRREKALVIGCGISCLDKCPTVDAVEVVHGKWEIRDDGYGCELMCCSVCKAEFYDGDNDTVDHPHNYCPNCGAKMDLED